MNKIASLEGIPLWLCMGNLTWRVGQDFSYSSVRQMLTYLGELSSPLYPNYISPNAGTNEY